MFSYRNATLQRDRGRTVREDLKKPGEDKSRGEDEVILLKDLVPRKDVKGGRQVPFGAQVARRGGKFKRK